MIEAFRPIAQNSAHLRVVHEKKATLAEGRTNDSNTQRTFIANQTTTIKKARSPAPNTKKNIQHCFAQQPHNTFTEVQQHHRTRRRESTTLNQKKVSAINSLTLLLTTTTKKNITSLHKKKTLYMS